MRSADLLRSWRVYALAGLLAIATLYLRVALSEWVGTRPVLILFVLPMMISAYVGGLGPGLFCTTLVGLSTAYFVMPPIHSFAFEKPLDFAQWLILVLIGVIASVLAKERSGSDHKSKNETQIRKYLSTERKVQGGFGIALACLGVIGVVSYLSVVRLNENAAWVQHTHEVIGSLDSLFAKTTEVQNAHRGYAITGDESYLESYAAATQGVAEDLQRLRTLIVDNPEQMQRLEQLASEVDDQMAFSQLVIETRRTQGFESAKELVLIGKGKQIHDRRFALVNEMKAVEGNLLKIRERQAHNSSIVTQSVIIGGGVLAVSCVGLALFAIRRDFTGRQVAEAQLERFFSLSLDFLCISSADGYFKRVSPAVTDILGWSVDEFLRKPYLDFVHPDDHAATLREVENQVLRGEKVLQFENRYRHRDGSWRVLSWRSIPQPDGLMYASARDVTERKRIEQELRDAKENLEQRVTERTAALMRTTRNLELEIDERQQVQQKLHAQLQRLNLLQHITRAIGERQDMLSIFQVVIRTLEEQLPADFACLCTYDAATSSLTVTSVGLRSASLAMELALTEQARVDIDENGLSRCVRGSLVYEPDLNDVPFPFPQRLLRGGLQSMVAAPLHSESRVFGVLIATRLQPNSFSSGECEFLRQLSEHVALAAHQAGLYGSLQTAYEDLRQTQQAVMQQERLRVLGQMASGIAHDINNAISPVTLYTESLLEGEPNLSERTRSYLQIIQRAITDVAETVSRMREFYRQREPQLTLAPVQLNVLVPQVAELTRARWSDMPQQRGCVIRLQTELAADLPPIMGIESELREALTNLIFNAVDAMPKGGTLTLHTALNDKQVELTVGDTGVGMDEDTKRRCIELFFTTKGERGTGLGLAMVYGTAQRHNAELSIDSMPGSGTRMCLSFAVPSAAKPSVPRIALPLPEQLRILVIDDDPVLLKSLKDTLDSHGYVIVTASGGQEGIDVFLTAIDTPSTFDVVITDLGMPFVDGRRVASTVKSASPETPVIMLTGWGQRLVAEGENPTNVDRVLSKPPRLQELRTALSELCTERPS